MSNFDTPWLKSIQVGLYSASELHQRCKDAGVSVTSNNIAYSSRPLDLEPNEFKAIKLFRFKISDLGIEQDDANMGNILIRAREKGFTKCPHETPRLLALYPLLLPDIPLFFVRCEPWMDKVIMYTRVHKAPRSRVCIDTRITASETILMVDQEVVFTRE